MNIAFFCSTPYQILLAINLTYRFYSESKVDLYILDHFKDAEQVKNNIDATNKLFNKIEVIKCREFSKEFSDRNPLRRHYRKAKALLNYKYIGQKYFNIENNKYDEVFFTYPDIIIQIALKILYKGNNNMTINMYEDGTGGYSDTISDSSFIKKIFNRFTGTSEILDYYNYFWMFKPELYTGNITTKEIKTIPPISVSDKRLKEIINNTFGYKEINVINEKVVFFDQPIHGFEKGSFDKVLNNVNQVFVSEFIVKLHPRSEWDADRYISNISTYTNKQIPWEVLALNSDIENKILISYFSTALTSNKMIFDVEPNIIFLYEIEEFKEINEISDDLKDFSLKLKELYRDSSKVFIPKNLSSFKQIIEELYNIQH